MRKIYLLLSIYCVLLIETQAVVIVQGSDIAGHNDIAARESHNPIGSLGGCTGTLISPTQVLSAAHCGNKTSFTLDGMAPVPIVSRSVNPNYVPMETGDMQIFTLATPITTVAPATLALNFASFADNMTMHTSGYGQKWQAQIPSGSTAGIPGATARTGYVNKLDGFDFIDDKYVFDLDVPGVNTQGGGWFSAMEGGGAPGDSGSPVFVDAPNGLTYLLAVIVSGSSLAHSEAGDLSFAHAWQSEENLEWLHDNGIFPVDWNTVPEPSKVLLIAFGILPILTKRRRR